MPGEASRENGKKGGRPKGSKNAASLERDAVAAAFRQRVLENADKLFQAQLSLAEGCSFVYRKVGGKWIVETNPEAIRAFLEGHRTEDTEHRMIHTERPNNFAIQDMLNRALGKPKETLEVQGGSRPLIVDRVRTRAQMLEALGEGDDDAGTD